MRVELAIEQLVLVGFDPRERFRIGDAIERELEASIGRADLAAFAWRDATEPLLRAPDAHIDHSRAAAPSSEDLARGVAGSIRTLLATVPAAPRGTAAARTVECPLR